MTSDYFHKIDSEHKAYWLGFIYADGCIDKEKRALRLDITIKDILHLEKLCNDLNVPIDKIGTHKVKNNYYCKICIPSKDLVNDLIQAGCIPRKSLVLKFPPEDILPMNVVNHFIRGYFDGDGCICLSKGSRKSRKKIQTDERFPRNVWFLKLLGTEDVLLHIQNFLPEKINITSEGNVKRLKCGGAPKVYRTLSYLYENSTIYLDRKHDKFIELQAYVLKK